MKNNIFLFILILILIISCKKESNKIIYYSFNSINISENNYITNINNKFITTINIINNEKYNEIIVYEKYLVFIKIKRNDFRDIVIGFEVYQRDINKNYLDHLMINKPIYKSKDYAAAWFMGIYKQFLIIDYGTAPVVHDFEIFDLNNNNIIFSGNWDGSSINFKNEDEVYVYKYKNECEIDKNNPVVKYYKLHEYLFNLNTKKLVNTRKIYEFLGN